MCCRWAESDSGDVVTLNKKEARAGYSPAAEKLNPSARSLMADEMLPILRAVQLPIPCGLAVSPAVPYGDVAIPYLQSEYSVAEHKTKKKNVTYFMPTHSGPVRFAGLRTGPGLSGGMAYDAPSVGTVLNLQPTIPHTDTESDAADPPHQPSSMKNE